MTIDLLEDEELVKYLRRSERPDFQQIVFFAKKHGIKTPSDLWEFFDKATEYWSRFKSTEGDVTY